jgi:hypothetical protein
MGLSEFYGFKAKMAECMASIHPALKAMQNVRGERGEWQNPLLVTLVRSNPMVQNEDRTVDAASSCSTGDLQRKTTSESGRTVVITFEKVFILAMAAITDLCTFGRLDGIYSINR